jgi:hypothetical protein
MVSKKMLFIAAVASVLILSLLALKNSVTGAAVSPSVEGAEPMYAVIIIIVLVVLSLFVLAGAYLILNK